MPDRDRPSGGTEETGNPNEVGGPDDETSGRRDGSHATPSEEASEQSAAELPADVVADAERLTRLARRAVDDQEAAAYREERAELLAAHDYTARLREDEDGEVLVCHPVEWLADDAEADEPAADDAPATGGAVDPEQIDDVDRAVEVHLDGSDDPDDWDAVYEQNREVAAAVREAHGDVHGENAAELAEYASNHYAKPVSALTAAELEHFREDYYTRNVWPTDEQAAALDRSLELVYEELSVPLPEE